MTSQAIKDQIRKNFNRAYKTCDKNCHIQQYVACCAVNLLLNYQSHFNVIADIACGTGESTKILLRKINQTQCYAIDFSPWLLDIAKDKLAFYNNINFICADFEAQLPFKQSLDLIFCNMGLQWAVNFHKKLTLFKFYLMKKGVLLFSVPVQGNFPELSTDCKLELFDHNELIKILSSLGFEVIGKSCYRLSKNFTEYYSLLKHLKNTGANYNKKALKRDSFLCKKNSDFFVGNNMCLTYKIGVYLIRKK